MGSNTNKVVITFGVFDMLHIGHILFFKRARELGEHLVVAIQEDEVIQKYKPDTPMVYTTEERMFMVSTIKYVDEVITYKDVDIDIQRFDFDTFAKGPDQNHEGFQRAEEWCKKNGKEIVVIPRTEGISSSMLRDYSKTR